MRRFCGFEFGLILVVCGIFEFVVLCLIVFCLLVMRLVVFGFWSFEFSFAGLVFWMKRLFVDIRSVFL